MTRASWEPPRYSDQDHDALSYILYEWAAWMTPVFTDPEGTPVGDTTPPFLLTQVEIAMEQIAQRLYDRRPQYDPALHRDWMWHHTPEHLRALAHQRRQEATK